MLWISAAVSFAVLVFNMATGLMAGVSAGYAFGYSLPHLVLGALLAAPAFSLTRGRPWARKMAKVMLIVQTVMQSLFLLSGEQWLWALFLLPLSIAGLVSLGRPLSGRFFAIHRGDAVQDHAQQYAPHPGQPHYGQQYGQPPYGPQQPVGERYVPQQPHAQPPQNGPWGPPPQQ
ncbi:hypothetical protein IDM40_06650 [Nocardiopsis sp. HNM0947]|uniref:Uncharacterized protein n=2 Tax=Nocardiopsis coralli TaxID=2772213 RepID=A0ABR9P3F8_9ACTN|nr:hypothetical protein [Nocardiopsis coralli]